MTWNDERACVRSMKGNLSGGRCGGVLSWAAGCGGRLRQLATTQCHLMLLPDGTELVVLGIGMVNNHRSLSLTMIGVKSYISPSEVTIASD